MAQKTGKNSKVTINGATVCVSSWSIDTSIEELDGSTTCDGGFISTISGRKNASWSFTTFYDDTYQESAGVLANVEEDDVISIEIFAENVDITPYFDAPTARVSSISVSADVNGLVTVTYSGTSNGEYAWKAEVTT